MLSKVLGPELLSVLAAFGACYFLDVVLRYGNLLQTMKCCSVPHLIKSSAKHCVMLSFLFLYLGLIHIKAMSVANYRGVRR